MLDIFFLMIRRPPRSPLFPYTPLFQSNASHPTRTAPGTWPPSRYASRPRASSTRGRASRPPVPPARRSEEHTSELQSRQYLVCRLLLEKKKTTGHASTAHDFIAVPLLS